MANLVFSFPKGPAEHLTVTRQDGVTIYQDGQELSDVALDADGLPADPYLRDAVQAGIAQVIQSSPQTGAPQAEPQAEPAEGSNEEITHA